MLMSPVLNDPSQPLADRTITSGTGTPGALPGQVTGQAGLLSDKNGNLPAEIMMNHPPAKTDDALSEKEFQELATLRKWHADYQRFWLPEAGSGQAAMEPAPATPHPAALAPSALPTDMDDAESVRLIGEYAARYPEWPALQDYVALEVRQVISEAESRQQAPPTKRDALEKGFQRVRDKLAGMNGIRQAHTRQREVMRLGIGGTPGQPPASTPDVWKMNAGEFETYYRQVKQRMNQAYAK